MSGAYPGLHVAWESHDGLLSITICDSGQQRCTRMAYCKPKHIKSHLGLMRKLEMTSVDAALAGQRIHKSGVSSDCVKSSPILFT